MDGDASGRRTPDAGRRTPALRAWLLATRPKTLPASVIPVAVGGALAATTPVGFSWWHWVGCLVGALLIQVAVNFANDAFDGISGADAPDRLGPARAVAQGWITPRAMFVATGIVLALALVIGCVLADRGGWVILALGLVSLVCALAYTGGPFPLAHHGLGDVFVLVFFGHFAVLGTAWIQVAPLVAWNPDGALVGLPVAWWVAATAVGLQAAAILCVNNVRDRVTDARVGKRTLAVRLGDRGGRILYALMQGAAAACWIVLAWAWTPWLAIPAGLATVGGALLSYGVARTNGAALNGYLARSAGLEVITGLSATVVLTTL